MDALRRRRAGALTIAVLTAPLAGCGGPSDAEQARAERAWSAKAEEICQFIGAEMTSRGKAGDINDIERYATETTGLTAVRSAAHR